MSSQIFLEAVSCPRCWGHEFMLSTEEGSKGNAAEQGLFCITCKEWTTTRPRPAGLHLTQPQPAPMGSAALNPGDDPNAIPETGPTDVRVWAWLLARLLEEAKRELAAAYPGEVVRMPGARGHRTVHNPPVPPVYDHATRWLQGFYASEHGKPPQELIPALENAAKGGV